MYHIIGTVEQMEALSASLTDWLLSQILERLKQRIETLQECYGADRDLEADLGGYVVLFPSMTLEEKTEHRNILEKYHTRNDEYEYEEIISTEDGQEWVEELYILSADFGIVMFYPVATENGGMYSDKFFLAVTSKVVVDSILAGAGLGMSIYKTVKGVRAQLSRWKIGKR